jgi:ribonuclease-3
MSKGERQGSEHAKLHIVANCFEALLGAVYLDKGYEEAKKIVNKYILSNVDDVLESGSWRDPKSHLQEITQRTDGVIPEYRVVDEAGPDHDKTFTVAVYVGDREIGRGMGGSKQHAEQAAATAAMDACGEG